MLNKKQRMTRQEFAEVFVSGKRRHSPFFQVVYDTKERKHPIFAVVVSKKVAKTAVGRNALKRRLYDILQHLRATQQVSNGGIIITKKQVKDATPLTLKLELKQLFQ